MDIPFDLLINAIIAGLLLGGFYAAVTAGISISFGILDIVNIAHPAFIILGAFSKYAEFFYQNPATIAVAFLVAVILSAIYLLVGILSLPAASRENQMAAAISLGNMNSVLIVVFATHFFGPLEATVAALYLFPFFAFILPLRIYKNWRLPHGLVYMDDHP